MLRFFLLLPVRPFGLLVVNVILIKVLDQCRKMGHEVEKLVVGCPLHMNGDFGERAKKSEEFGTKLSARTGLPVVYWDERLTTVEADEIMKEAGVRREHRKDYVDKIAAVLILQGYLDSL